MTYVDICQLSFQGPLYKRGDISSVNRTALMFSVRVCVPKVSSHSPCWIFCHFRTIVQPLEIKLWLFRCTENLRWDMWSWIIRMRFKIPCPYVVFYLTELNVYESHLVHCAATASKRIKDLSESAPEKSLDTEYQILDVNSLDDKSTIEQKCEAPQTHLRWFILSSMVYCPGLTKIERWWGRQLYNSYEPVIEHFFFVACDRFLIQWNLSATTTSIIKCITCDLFSNVFKWRLKVTIYSC